jgi:NADP-dependent 3-hydroxy acid dehydrogenase YdfG
MTTTLITGATRGLGREAARRLRAEGHTVYLGARDATRGAEVAALIGAIPLAIDVTDDRSIAAVVARVRDECRCSVCPGGNM